MQTCYISVVDLNVSRPRLPVWTVPVTDTLDKLLEEAVNTNTNVSKSDLIREAVREKLAQMGYTYDRKGAVITKSIVESSR